MLCFCISLSSLERGRQRAQGHLKFISALNRNGVHPPVWKGANPAPQLIQLSPNLWTVKEHPWFGEEVRVSCIDVLFDFWLVRRNCENVLYTACGLPFLWLYRKWGCVTSWNDQLISALASYPLLRATDRELFSFPLPSPLPLPITPFMMSYQLLSSQTYHLELGGKNDSFA